MAGDDADEELRRPGEDEVGLLGGARAGVDAALAGFDGDRLLTGAEFDGDGGFVGCPVDEWEAGEPADWADESFKIAKKDTFGDLPEPNARGSFRLSDDYLSQATQDVLLQLSKGGVRLAFILNKALKKP